MASNFLGVDQFRQLEQFNHELDKLIERVRGEYDMSYEAVIGALQVASIKLGMEALEEEQRNLDSKGEYPAD